MSIADPMDTTQFKVGHLLHNLYSAISDLEEMRRSNDARRILIDNGGVADVELCRDRLSRILDDVGGK